MSISTLTSKCQVTIPKEIRKRLGIQERDKISFIIRGKDVLIKPIKGNILDLRGIVKPKNKPENLSEIRKIIRKKRHEKRFLNNE